MSTSRDSLISQPKNYDLVGEDKRTSQIEANDGS